MRYGDGRHHRFEDDRQVVRRQGNGPRNGAGNGHCPCGCLRRFLHLAVARQHGSRNGRAPGGILYPAAADRTAHLHGIHLHGSQAGQTARAGFPRQQQFRRGIPHQRPGQNIQQQGILDRGHTLRALLFGNLPLPALRHEHAGKQPRRHGTNGRRHLPLVPDGRRGHHAATGQLPRPQGQGRHDADLRSRPDDGMPPDLRLRAPGLSEYARRLRRHHHPGNLVLAGTRSAVALGSQDHGDPLPGFGLLADLLDPEHRPLPLPSCHRLRPQIQ